MNLTICPIKFCNSTNNKNVKSDSSVKNTDSIIIKNNTKTENYKKDSLKKRILIEIFSEEKAKRIKEKVKQQGKQIFSGNEFFINMTDYKKDEQWAKQMETLTYFTSIAISSKVDFDSILNQIERNVEFINRTASGFINYDASFGIRRKMHHCFGILEGKRGSEYIERYNEKSKTKNAIIELIGKTLEMYCPKSNEEYNEANVSKIGIISRYGIGKELLRVYQDSVEKYTISNLSLVKKEFNKLRAMENPTAEEVLRSCAIIQWLIAQETPYQRGSDSIANVLTKAIMHANNIYISPLKEGVSLDFEAFDTDLDDYIERYPNFFEVRPYKIEG